jgi:hypothetical protein
MNADGKARKAHVARAIQWTDSQPPSSNIQHPTTNIQHPTMKVPEFGLHPALGHPLPIDGNGAAGEGSQSPDAEQNF